MGEERRGQRLVVRHVVGPQLVEDLADVLLRAADAGRMSQTPDVVPVLDAGCDAELVVSAGPARAVGDADQARASTVA